MACYRLVCYRLARYRLACYQVIRHRLVRCQMVCYRMPHFADNVTPVLQRPLRPALLAGRITEPYSER